MQTRTSEEPRPSSLLKTSRRKAVRSAADILSRLKQLACVMAKPKPSTVWKVSPVRVMLKSSCSGAVMATESAWKRSPEVLVV